MLASSGSKSTDKLDVLMEGMAKWPAEAFSRIKSANITWEMLEHPDQANGSIFAPNLKVEFYEKG